VTPLTKHFLPSSLFVVVYVLSGYLYMLGTNNLYQCSFILFDAHYKCKKTTFIKTVIGDVVAHLKPQKFTVLSDL